MNPLTMKNCRLNLLLGFLLIASTSMAQKAPKYAWLAGSWEGDGFGGKSEEVWSAPDENGVMMGMFRHYNSDGSFNFYEFMVLDEDGLKLKHFSEELEAWESKSDYVNFKMKNYDKKTIELKGLTFHFFKPDSMEIHLNMKNESGEYTEIFHMKRKK